MPRHARRHRPDLHSNVERLEYDFLAREGRLQLPTGCCVSMGPAIDLFRRLDPEVKLIRTFAGPVPDTLYRRHGRTEWEAEHEGRCYGRVLFA
jgi:hypothetical protein